MKSFFRVAAFAAAASAAALRRDQCCFEITATGGVSGVMGQLSDGQNRINGSYSPATYCYSNGGITDSAGRGCVVTYTNDATHQFQCDLNSTPTYGFTISSNGSILYEGSDQFYACPATDTEYNVYTTWLTGQDKCKAITLSTTGMNGTCSTASSSASACSIPASTVTVTVEASSCAAQATTTVYITSVPESSQIVPGYSVPSSSEYTTTAVSVPAYSSSAPGYTAVSTAIESTYVASSPVESTYVASTSQAISTYPAESTSTSFYEISTSVAMGSSSAPVESATTMSAYSVASSIVPTASVVVSSSSAAVVYSSVETSISYADSSVSIPGYGSTSAQSSTTPVATSSETQTSIPGYGTSASSIYSSTSAASTPAVSSYESSSSTPATSTTASVCQTSLSGSYQTPHLIVPISSSQPDTAYGTQYDATINSTTSTIFNFDIPSSYSGMTCTLIFLFPEQADLETSSYTFSGSGSLVFAELSGVATEETTYDNAPSVESTLDTIAIESGNSYVVYSGTCAAGTTESIEVSSSGGLSLEFFEDWNPSSLGLFLTAC